MRCEAIFDAVLIFFFVHVLTFVALILLVVSLFRSASVPVCVSVPLLPTSLPLSVLTPVLGLVLSPATANVNVFAIAVCCKFSWNGTRT